MKLPSVLPPADLLEQVEGIEDGLRRGQRLGRLGQLGLLLSALQALAVVANSEWWADLQKFEWRGLLAQWPLLLALFIFLFSLYLVSWTRFWLKESKDPFHYTFSIAEFAPVVPSGEDDPWSWLPRWMEYDLSRHLNERIGRLSLLEEKYLEGEEAAKKPLSHVHISGAYLVRQEPDQRWVIEVTPRVRIGPPGSPETLAHTVRYELPEAAATLAQSGDQSLPSASLPGPQEYRQLLERVYFSVASQIYKQIRQDVQRKIDLLPSRRFRAAAYFYEAEDYARSNTLDAYDEARQLYAEAVESYDPRRIQLSESRWRRVLQRVVRRWIDLGRALRRRAASLWPQMGEVEIMSARAELGYANMLLYRRVLASLSGRSINPVYEAKPRAERAIEWLLKLPPNVAGWRDSLFNGYVTLALAWYYLDDTLKARESLEEARRLMPARAEGDARYLFADGEVEARVRTELSIFQRAVELDPKFEIAQFQLAYATEMLWRMRPTLEESVAKTVFDEYERVVEINPGNLATWSNLAYIHWLLGDHETRVEHIKKARQAFQSGREYKEIKRETFVAEIDYGLIRIAAESGDFDEAYRHYTNAISAQIAQGFSHGGGFGQYYRYYFAYIGAALFERFRRYKDRVEAKWNEYRNEDEPRYAHRILDNVMAFVLNDYGEACYQYYSYTGDERWVQEARSSFYRAAELNSSYVIPYYNLHSLERTDNPEEAKSHIEMVDRLAPKWPDGSFALAETLVRWALGARDRVASLRKEVDDLRQEAGVIQSEAQRSRDEASRPDTSQSKAPKKEQAAVNLESAAREMEKQAADKLEEASAKEKEAGRLEEQVPEAFHIAEDRLRALLPHKWLWKDENLALEAFDRQDYADELKWQREFDDLHVHALFNLAKVMRHDEFGHPERARKVFDHIRRFFWPNSWDLIVELLEMEPGNDDLKARICAAVRRWRVEFPQAFWPVTWLNHDAFLIAGEAQEEKNKEIEKNLLDAAGEPDLHGHIYKWIGDQWIYYDRLVLALAAYRLAMHSADATLLVDIAGKLEEKDALDDCLEAYSQAQNQDEQAGETDRLYSQDFYHYHLGQVLWKLERYSEALEEIKAVQGGSDELPEEWRSELARVLIDSGKVETPETYHLLKGWLTAGKPGCLQEADRQAYTARLLLGREKYPQLARPGGGYLPNVFPSITPIAVEADERLFPQGEDWWQDHSLFKVFIPEMRQRIETDMGVEVPGVRIRSKEDVEPGDYTLLVFDVPRAWGKVEPGHWYFPKDPAGQPPLKPDAPQPQPAWNPRTGELDGGVWIDPSNLQDDPVQPEHWDVFLYMIYHLERICRLNLAELLDLQRLYNMLEEWKSAGDPDERTLLLESALPDRRAHVVALLQVLRALLRESVPVVDLSAILESFARMNARPLHHSDMTEAARLALRTWLPGRDGSRELVCLSPDFERSVADGLRAGQGRRFLALEPGVTQDLLDRLDASLKGRQELLALVVRQPGLRPFVYQLVTVNHPSVAVLAEDELDEGLSLLVGEQVA